MALSVHLETVSGRPERQAVCLFWVVLLVVGVVGEVFAFSTALKYSTEARGEREVLSFYLPPGAARPKVELIERKMLRVSVPGILALPAMALDTDRSRWVSSFGVEDLPGGALGIHLFIGLKEENLSFRDSLGKKDPVAGTLYRLELDRLPSLSDGKKTQILEGRVLSGRDGTLIVFSRTGTDPIERSVELGARLVHLYWHGATLASSWRLVEPGGLAERVLAYDFSRDQVEMEILLHDATVDIDFHEDAETGLFIVELTSRDGIGRQTDIRELLFQRKAQLEASSSLPPLNRLDPVFMPRPGVTVMLQGQPTSESYFMAGAKQAAKDRNFAKARAYLDKLLQLFPETPNRQIVDLYKWELASHMDWKPGWLLTELRKILARYPNMLRYPEYRFLQLRLLNQATRYEDASAIFWDPNLPKNRADVWLERGYTAMGLARSALSAEANWQAAEKYLRRARDISENRGDVSAEANYLLARLAQERSESGGREAVQILDGLSTEQVARIANRPEWLMAMADIYYENRLYPQAFKLYSQFLSNYPGVSSIVPWALLRAAESSRLMGNKRDAQGLFDNLQKRYRDYDGAAWGRIFQLRMDESQDVDARLAALDAAIKTIALPDVLSEALRIKAELQGDNQRYQEALRTLNNLLSLSSRDRVAVRAKKLKLDYLEAGVQKALADDRPEYALLLAEVHGEDWRNDPAFVAVQVGVSEALLRLGLYDKALRLLQGVASAPPASGLMRLARAFREKRWPAVPSSPAFVFPSRGGGGSSDADEALSVIGESVPVIGDGIPSMEPHVEGALIPAAASGAPNLGEGIPSVAGNRSSIMDKLLPASQVVTVEEARVRLDEAGRLVDLKEWRGIVSLLEELPGILLNKAGQDRRLWLMAKAEEGRRRYPQAVLFLESLLSEREMGDGGDYYWYGTLLQQWKGEAKASAVFARVTEEASDKEFQSLAHVRLGDLTQQSGDFSAAVRHYQEAVRLAPGTSWAKVSAENAEQLNMAMEVTQ